MCIRDRPREQFAAAHRDELDAYNAAIRYFKVHLKEKKYSIKKLNEMCIRDSFRPSSSHWVPVSASGERSTCWKATATTTQVPSLRA